MTNDYRTDVLRHLRRAAGLEDGRSDGQLLECFVSRRDEVAFEALVRRHGPTVWGVCRRVLGHQADAEDAFQVTFLVLAHKAAHVADRAALGSWLYGVAHNTALKARALNGQRREKEREAALRPRPEADRFAELKPLFDEELRRLPERYGAAVRLCDLEGRPLKEAAHRLGCPQGTVASRLARGRELLARRLSRHGLTLSAAALALALAQDAAAVPAPLLAATARVACLSAAGQTGALSAPTAVLLEGVMNAMRHTRITQTTAALAALLVVGFGWVGFAALGDSRAGRGEAALAADKPDKKDLGPSVNGTVKAVDTGKKTITVVVPTGKGKESAEKTFDLAKDVTVTLGDVLEKTKELPQGKLDDLTTGTSVSVQLAADGKTAVNIGARGPALHAQLKSADADKGTITVATKGKDGLKEETLTLVKGAKVLLNDGLSKGTADKEGKLKDLAEGTSVLVQLTVDRKRALSVRVQGKSMQGALKGIDTGTNFVTLTVKGESGPEDKTFKLAKDARVDPNAKAGDRVQVRLSVFDAETAVEIRAVE